MKAAVIDIGSNSIRYTVGSISQGRAVTEPKRLMTTRLAEGLIHTGRLSDEAMERSMEAIRYFIDQAEGLPVFAYATSAVRDAQNGAEFAERVRYECSISVDVLTGGQEAQYAMMGAAAGRCAGLIDIGGGSTQVITPDFSASFPIGCVRAREYAGDAEELCDMRAAVYARCDEVMDLPITAEAMAGVGGTITTLAALDRGLEEYDRGRVDGYMLSTDDVERLVNRLYRMGDTKRKASPLLSKRHDVIIYGALLLLYAADRLGLKELTVSDRDGMEGFLEAKLLERAK